MKAFIDTSSLVKKYIAEKGSEEFENILQTVTEIIVSPVYRLETNSVLTRRLKEKTLSGNQLSWILTEVKKDLNFFNIVIWNEHLEEKAIEFVQKYGLKTLDSLQLAAGCLAQADIFITSDKKLYKIGKKELQNIQFV